MTVLVEDKPIEEPPSATLTIRQKCASCLRGPNLLKTLVLTVCTAIVVQQLAACVGKLIDVPITTYTHFDFNKTILYPSVTFCREPPYKYDRMEAHGLYAHPRFTSTWFGYNFSTSLDDLWDDITYSDDDFFAQYGLDGEVHNVEIRPTIGFVMGRCHTLVPKGPNTRASRATGYSITLQHSAQDVATSTSIYPPGYHVFVHYTREPFTEIEVYNGGLVDYLYVYTGETVDVKMKVKEYKKISDYDDPCTTGDDYSANNCTSKCVWDRIGEVAGCSGPWMIISDLPRCNNYTAMRTLISEYIATYENHECSSCPRFCHALMYNAFVTDRQKSYTWDSTAQRWARRVGDAELQSQLYMYFNSMMVSVYEESYNYDWNLFISDLGGSVGFLLGISVIGLMAYVFQLWHSIIRPLIVTKRREDRIDSISSTVTAKISDDVEKEQEVLKKSMDWPKVGTCGFI